MCIRDSKRHEYNAALKEYSTVLTINPKDATALYGRGLAEQAQGAPGAQTDMAAAKNLDPEVAIQFAD